MPSSARAGLAKNKESISATEALGKVKLCKALSYSFTSSVTLYETESRPVCMLCFHRGEGESFGFVLKCSILLCSVFRLYTQRDDLNRLL